MKQTPQNKNSPVTVSVHVLQTAIHSIDRNTVQSKHVSVVLSFSCIAFSSPFCVFMFLPSWWIKMHNYICYRFIELCLGRHYYGVLGLYFTVLMCTLMYVCRVADLLLNEWCCLPYRRRSCHMSSWRRDQWYNWSLTANFVLPACCSLSRTFSQSFPLRQQFRSHRDGGDGHRDHRLGSFTQRVSCRFRVSEEVDRSSTVTAVENNTNIIHHLNLIG